MVNEQFQVAGADAAILYERHVSRIMEPFVDAVLKAADLQSSEALLDVACGPGIVARSAASLLPGLTVVGADLNEAMLTLARQLAPSIEWRQARADALPFESSTFNAITCQQGLQFFPDASAAVKEMTRVAAPGARVVATVWAPLERCPYFGAQAEALAEFAGPDVEQTLRKAVRADADNLLRDSFTMAGLVDVDVVAIEAVVELPPVKIYAGEQIAGTPWGQVYATMKPATQTAFCDHIADALSAYTDNSDIARVPFTSWLALGHKL